MTEPKGILLVDVSMSGLEGGAMQNVSKRCPKYHITDIQRTANDS